MKKITIAFLLLIVFSYNANAACNWKSKLTNFYAWDSCSNNKASVNAYIAFNTKGCFTYQWKVGSAVVGTNSPVLNYRITANGTYTVCVKVTDTCNKCDTTICSTRTISCFSNCIWKTQTPYFSAFDTCIGNGGRNSINAYISFKSRTCHKYTWTVNGVAQSTKNYYINYPVTANGTYVLCVKVTDTCNKCDTTFCSTRSITCFNTSGCNWKSKTNYYFWDSCRGSSNTGGNSLNAYVSLKSGSCYKYQWTVNSAAAGTGNIMHYNITANGTYNVCVKVTDTCNKCDTTICSTRSITCFNTSSCNWKSKINNFYTWDTCKGTGYRNNVNAYIAFKSSGCYKYEWTVNKAAAGNGYFIHYPITANGTYTICVKVTDTCNKCDTTLCASRTITCFSNSNTCNWKARTPYFYAWDTCKGSGAANSVNAYMSFKSFYCLKYVWSVNGVPQSNPNNSFIFHYPVKTNGTYVVCVKVIDTCNNCDTTICSTRSFTCFNSGKCNWKSKVPYFYAWDTCKGKGGPNSVNAYIGFNSRTCQKYTWTVNGVVQPTRNYYINYPITANGTYVLCVKVTDTCNKCDTTFCTTRTITCFNACNFASKRPATYVHDSCYGGKSNLAGYISFSNKSCLKYLWTIGGVAVSTNYYFNSSVYKNGTYTICVKVTDSCNKCDTTWCFSKTINCSSLGLNITGTDDLAKLYPQPVQNVLNIDWKGEGAVFEVFSMMGISIYKGELQSGQNAVRADAWPNGMYIVRISNTAGTAQYRIVVNR